MHQISIAVAGLIAVFAPKFINALCDDLAIIQYDASNVPHFPIELPDFLSAGRVLIDQLPFLLAYAGLTGGSGHRLRPLPISGEGDSWRLHNNICI